MFGGSSGELALIFLLALLVFGPERLPGLARNLGKLVRSSRVLVQSVWRQLEEEIDRGEKTENNKAAAVALARDREADACPEPVAMVAPEHPMGTRKQDSQ